VPGRFILGGLPPSGAEGRDAGGGGGMPAGKACRRASPAATTQCYRCVAASAGL